MIPQPGGSCHRDVLSPGVHTVSTSSGVLTSVILHGAQHHGVPDMIHHLRYWVMYDVGSWCSVSHITLPTSSPTGVLGGVEDVRTGTMMSREHCASVLTTHGVLTCVVMAP